MPEKKSVTEQTKKTVVEKPIVKKTVAKSTTVAAKQTTTVTAKAKPTPVKKPEVKAKAVKPTTQIVAKAKAAPAPKAEVKVAKVKPPVVLEEKKPMVAAAKIPEKVEIKKPAKGKLLNITLLKSGIGYSKRHKATLKALGFRHLHQTIQQIDSPSLRGMLAKVDHLVRIEEQVTK
ncbi:MAG: 50S ribosomal protein L30 [Anaerolineaceae bacterium]